MTEILNDVAVDLNEREKVILKELRYLYDERHGLLVFPLNAIAYRLIGRLLRDSIEEDRKMLHEIRMTVLSLAEKGVITILDKDDEEEHFVIAKEGLEIKTEKV